MRVLFLSLWYPNAENPVLGTFVHEQAVALREAGADIRIVQPLPLTPFPVPWLKASYRKLASIPQREIHQGFEVYHPRYLTLPRHLYFEHVGDWMYEGIRSVLTDLYRSWPFEIIHAHATYPCGHAANAVRDRDLPSVKVVHTIHGTDIRDAPTYNRRCLEKVRASLENADWNVFVSQEGRRLALDYTQGRCAGTSEYITNGVSTKTFQLSDADRAEVERMKDAGGEGWNLLFVGNVSEAKGIKELLEAVARLRDQGERRLRLFLVGHDKLGTYVDHFLKAHNLETTVRRIGPVPHERIKIWMNFADAFILPSHFEGLPTVLFEALYAGLPSVFTRVGGVGDIVEDGGHALLIEPRSIAAVENAIGRLMNSPALCRSLGDNGQRLIRENFTWAINAGRQMDVYRKVLHEAPGATTGRNGETGTISYAESIDVAENGGQRVLQRAFSGVPRAFLPTAWRIAGNAPEERTFPPAIMETGVREQRCATFS